MSQREIFQIKRLWGETRQFKESMGRKSSRLCSAVLLINHKKDNGFHLGQKKHQSTNVHKGSDFSFVLFCCCWLMFKLLIFFFFWSRLREENVTRPSTSDPAVYIGTDVCRDAITSLIFCFWWPCGGVFSFLQLISKKRGWGWLRKQFSTQPSKCPHFCSFSFGQNSVAEPQTNCKNG